MVQPDVTPTAHVMSNIGSAVVVRLQWRPRGATSDDERYQVLDVQNDKIREMVDCRTIREATKLAKGFAAPAG